MSLFFGYLKQINQAENEELRLAAVDGALDAIATADESDDWSAYADYGDWVYRVPELIRTKNKNAKKYLKVLLDLTARRNEARTETSDDLIKKIKRCKSIDDLEELKAGKNKLKHEDNDGKKSVLYLSLPLDKRIERLDAISLEEAWQVRIALAEKEKYLTAKRRADKWAWPLTIILCMFGVGVVCGIAMFAALPALGIVGLLLASAGIGYVEIPVFYSYVKRSLRNLFVRGLFQSIDNHLLKQIAAQKNLKDRREFTAEQEQAVLKEHKHLLRFKYIFSSVGGVLAAIATVGFSALAYMQVVEVLPLLAITGIPALVAPWFFAVVAGLYFFVLFDNIFRAIKNNIFQEIWGKLTALINVEGWRQATTKKECAKWIALLVVKILSVIAVFAIATVATVFTAGAWLQGSAGFFTTAFNIVPQIAEIIGTVIGSILIGATFSFNIENCLKTVVSFAELVKGVGKNISSYVAESIKMVNDEPVLPYKIGIAIWRILRPIVKFAPLILHVIGVGLVSAQGTDAAILRPSPENEAVVKGLVAGAQAVGEALEDSHTLMHDHDDSDHDHDDHHHEHKKCDSHEHADPAADVEWLAGKAKAGVLCLFSLFQRCGKPVEAPEAIERVSITISP